MKIKFLVVQKNNKKEYYFNELDSQIIISQCQSAGKKWAQELIGFFVNEYQDNYYTAITLKRPDGLVESMEYVDIDTHKPEFYVDSPLVELLAEKDEKSEIPFNIFEPLFNQLLFAPVKARRFEVYPDITHYYL